MPTTPTSRSRTPLILAIVGAVACLGLVLVLVLGGVGVAFFFNQLPDDQTSDSPEGGELVAPPGAPVDQPYLELSTSSDGPVVDVYIDFLCPHCATFHDAQSEDLTQMALDSEITLRVHPRPMLDASSSPAGYSGRAANAAVCASAENPEQWFPAENVLFENQPGAEGLTDEELSTFITEANDRDVSDCIAEGTYLPWIQEVVEPEALETTSGTPAVLIDGELFTGDTSEAGSVKSAVEAA